jgi:hypothetical protein
MMHILLSGGPLDGRKFPARDGRREPKDFITVARHEMGRGRSLWTCHQYKNWHKYELDKFQLFHYVEGSSQEATSTGSASVEFCDYQIGPDEGPST